MISEKNAPRLAGAAFLIVFAASVLSDVLLKTVIGSGTVSEFLVDISTNLSLVRISSLVALSIQSTGIIALAVLLYFVLKRQNRIVATVALGWWLAEGITLAVSKIGAIALIPLSQEFVKAGAPKHCFYQIMGDFLYYGIDQTGYEIHMLFYCLGGILWFSLFYKSRMIPRFISVWGIAAESVALAGTVLTLSGVSVNILFFAHIAVLEIVVGIWLMMKGVNPPAITPDSAGRP